MGEVIEIEHVSWNVSDLERSKRFYQDLLGFEVLDYLQGGGPWVDELCGTKDTYHQQYRMYAPKGPALTPKGPKFTLDILYWKNPPARVRRPLVSDFPQVHVAMGVKDLDATYERLKAKGAQFVSPPVHWTKEEGGWVTLFMYDPDGFLVELLQTGDDSKVKGEVITCEHIATTVSNLDRSKEFYIDLLGLYEVGYVEHHAGSCDIMCNEKGMMVREYRTRAPKGPGPAGKENGFTLDLIEWVTPRGAHRPPAMNEIPAGHFCFGVKDVWASYERLKANGVKFVSPPVAFPKEEGGWKPVSFHDPDGLMCELTEIG